MGKVSNLESASKKLAKAKDIDPGTITGQPQDPQHLDTHGARTESFINLDTKNQVVVCGDGNGGTFPVAIDLVS